MFSPSQRAYFLCVKFRSWRWFQQTSIKFVLKTIIPVYSHSFGNAAFLTCLFRLELYKLRTRLCRSLVFRQWSRRMMTRCSRDVHDLTPPCVFIDCDANHLWCHISRKCCVCGLVIGSMPNISDADSSTVVFRKRNAIQINAGIFDRCLKSKVQSRFCRCCIVTSLFPPLYRIILGVYFHILYIIQFLYLNFFFSRLSRKFLHCTLSKFIEISKDGIGC